MALRTSSSTRIQPASELETDYIKAGILYKRGKANPAWKRRYFILHSQNLYYYETSAERKGRGFIGPLKLYTIAPGQDDPKKSQFCFQLVPNDTNARTWYIYATSNQDKLDWMGVLRDATDGILPVTRVAVEIEKQLRRNAYEIPEQDIEFSNTSTAKKGASGAVRQGVWMKTTQVAIKTLNNLPEFTDASEMNSFYQEIQTLSQLRHPNIVSMIGYCKKDKQVCLITEFVNGGNLADYIHDNSFTQSLKIELCLSLCRGMIYIHSQSICHRDLKPANILIQNLESARIKICDMGLSGFTMSKSEGPVFGTAQYAAPELPKDSHNHKVDVYSFAIILWELVTKKRVWEGQLTSVFDRVERGERPQLPDNSPLCLLIEKCWAQDPAKRPEFSEIYEILENMKQNLDVSPMKGPKLSAEEKIIQGWGTKDSLSWLDFKKVLCKVLECAPPILEKLRYSLVTENDQVERNTWLTFMKWFNPLYIAPYGYQNSSEVQDEQIGYTIDQIADIVGPSWFLGFLSAEASQGLLEKRIGTSSYLFRFSSTPGVYTLSVASQTVGHWRITVKKTGNLNPIFFIDTAQYSSLYQIIEKHGKNRAPLPSKTREEFNLINPVDKNYVPVSSENLSVKRQN